MIAALILAALSVAWFALLRHSLEAALLLPAPLLLGYLLVGLALEGVR